MSDLSSLTDRERQVLRLLGRGHDAKSIAAALALSVHTINERLRSARRKLAVTSSREAARLLIAAEPPDFSGYEGLRVAAAAPTAEVPPRRHARVPVHMLGAVLMFVLAAAALTLAASHRAAPSPLPPRPQVVRTTPAADAVIAPGPFLLSITYDRPMRADSYSFVKLSADSYPDCATHAAQSRDGRTFTMRCTAVAGRTYRVAFNHPPYMHFESQDGSAATPFGLTFRTHP